MIEDSYEQTLRRHGYLNGNIYVINVLFKSNVFTIFIFSLAWYYNFFVMQIYVLLYQ